MIKKIFLVLVALNFSNSLVAQTLIPRVGVSLATMTFEDDPDGEDISYKLSPGIALGVGYSYTLSEKVTLLGELLFLQAGFDSRYNYFYDDGDGYVESTDYKTTAKIYYLQLPVLARYTFGGNTKFYVNAGPSIGFGLGGKYKDSYEGYYDDSGQIGTYSDSYKGDVKFEERPIGYEGNDFFADNRLDFQLQVGGGVHLFDKIMIDLRYGVGLTDLIDSGKSKHKVLQITVGVPIHL